MSIEAAQRTKTASKLGDLHILGSNEDCAVGTLETCVLLYWRRHIVAEGSSWTRRAFLDIRKQYPKEKVSFFTVVDANCSLDTPVDVRRELAELLKMYDAHLADAAITFEGKGFKMTMVRSIITAIYMASRTQFPNSVFGDVDAAAAWTAMHAPSLRASAILSAIEHLRR
jgi:hypothetical protein